MRSSTRTKQPPPRLTDFAAMTWWDFNETNGVLEFDMPALELHWQLLCGRSLAWWCDEWGRWLGLVRVGSA